MTKIKICGITRDEDAAFAEELGADFLGFIFVPESPRYVTRAPRSERAKRVGVFRGASFDQIQRTIDEAQLDLVQLHMECGGESRRFQSAGSAAALRIIHAFHVKDALPDTTTDADYVLFDTGGGTGRVFDWNLLQTYPRTKPFFLAGGIDPDNVAAAIAATRPFAIDVASGVEASPGIKDPHKLKLLFERVKAS